MLRPDVDAELPKLRASEPIPGEHAPDCLAQHLRGTSFELLPQRAAAEPARIARVAVIDLVVELLARHSNLFRVHDHDEVARVDVRRVLGLALAAQRVGDAGREPPERLPFGIDYVPAALDLARLCVPGLHVTEKRRTQASAGPDGTS